MKKNILNRKLLTAIIALTFVASAISTAPFINAQQLVPTSLFVSEYPNPVQINGNAIIVGWIFPLPFQNVTAPVYYNVTLKVTAPDGSIKSKTMDSSNAATVFWNYVPSQAGNYQVVLTWPGDPQHQGGTSNTYSFTVTSQTLPAPPQNPLPTGQWSYPISEVNYNWWQISGDWAQVFHDLGASNYNPYTASPMTPHVLWTYQIFEGGLLGGENGVQGIERPGYTCHYSNMVESHGVLYYVYQYGGNEAGIIGTNDEGTPQASNGTYPILYAVSEITGKLLWSVNLPCYNYTTGQYYAPAESGGTGLFILDSAAAKGKAGGQGQSGAYGSTQYGNYWIWVTGGALWKIDPNQGNVIYYNLNSTWGGAKYYDSLWYYYNNGVLSTYDAESSQNTGPNYYAPPVFSISAANGTQYANLGMPTYITENTMVYYHSAQTIPGAVSTEVDWLTTFDASTGQFIANGTASYGVSVEGSSRAAGDGIFMKHCADGTTRAWSFQTGSLLWTTEPQNLPWGNFGNYQASIGGGVAIQASYDGYKYAYDDKTGKLLWKQYTGTNNMTGDNPYLSEYPEGQPGSWGLAVMTSNMVYWASGEHTPTTPTAQGDMLYANDLHTGKLIWVLPGIQGGRTFLAGIANGILWYHSYYNGQVYGIGQGPSQTTVSVSPAIGDSQSMTIQGTVTDISPGAKPNTPAVSDASQGSYMSYLYCQEPLTVQPTGVTLHLFAVRADGTTVDITHVTTDASGHYAYTWTPSSPDTYTIVAAFEGSGAYYSSFAESAQGVVATPTPTLTPTQTPISASDIASQVVSQLPSPTTAPTASPYPTLPPALNNFNPTDMYIAIAIAVVVIVIALAVAVVVLMRRPK